SPDSRREDGPDLCAHPLVLLRRMRYESALAHGELAQVPAAFEPDVPQEVVERGGWRLRVRLQMKPELRHVVAFDDEVEQAGLVRPRLPGRGAAAGSHVASDGGLGKIRAAHLAGPARRGSAFLFGH